MKRISESLRALLSGETHKLQGDKLDNMRAIMESHGFDVPEKTQPDQRGHIARLAPYRELVGTALESRIERTLKLKTGEGCNCKTLVNEMNQWGIEGCKKNRQYIIDTLMQHRVELSVSFASSAVSFAKSMGVVDSFKLGTKLVADFVMMKDVPLEAEIAGANWLLDKAIDDVTASNKLSAARRSEPRQPRPRMLSRGMFHYDSVNQPKFIKSTQLQTDILTLLSKIPSDITAIAGVARSGLSVATMLSMYLHLPMITIRQTSNDIVDTGNGWRLGGSKHVSPKHGKILVVDDTVMTGNSIKAIRPLVQRELGDHLFAAVYVNPAAKLKPDIYAVDLPWPHILEWNVFNSVLSSSYALDFDGILCHDCPPGSDDDGEKYLDFIKNARPLYVPRKAPVPLVVTARIEKYRQPTLDWLRRHNINVVQLVMHPAATLRERQRDDIAAYKAHHFSNWLKAYKARVGPQMFFESEDRQARKIALLSGGVTVCPATAGVYGPQNSMLPEMMK
jgi:adenine/guanine phosphoribosyltransferase-like PRPP-binding protein